MPDFARYATLFQQLISKHATFPGGKISLQRSEARAEAFFDVAWKTRQYDVAGMKARISQQQACISVHGSKVSTTILGFPVELQNIKHSIPSPDGRLICIIRTNKNEKASEDVIEIWSKSGLVSQKQTSKIHGDVYADANFASVGWDSASSKVIYIAEELGAKNAHFFDESVDQASTPLEQRSKFYEYRQDWGEQVAPHSRGLIFLYDVASNSVQAIPKLSSTHSYGQVIFAKDGESVVATAWDILPRRYGIRFCDNRKSKIFKIRCDGSSEPECLTPDDNHFYFGPSFSPDGKKLLFFSVRNIEAHSSTYAAHLVDCETSQSRLLVDYVASPSSTEVFPGLYGCRSEVNPWINNNQILLTSQWNFQTDLLVINAQTGEIRRTNKSDYSWTILDILPASESSSGLGLFVRSKFSEPSSLLIAPLPANLTQDLEFATLATPSQDDRSGSLKYQVIPFYADGFEKSPASYFEALLIEAHPEQKSDKLVVFPHGGPHSSFDTKYSTALTFLANLGYNILLVNYRGSLGYGSDHLEALIGHVGDRDVKDVYQATQAVLSLKGYDAKKTTIIGGSHGGFLGAHLVGQYPTSFRACALRNPVINITSMLGSTDIPDWCLGVTGHSRDALYSAEIVSKMFDSSPLRWAHQIESRVMLLIGAQDKRVPPEQSIQFYHYLKCRSKDVRMVVYPEDCHGLTRVDTELDQWVNIAAFFEDALALNEGETTPSS